MFDKLRESAGALAGKAGDVMNMGVEGLKGTIDELMDAAPYLEEVGYRMTDVELLISAPPRVAVDLVQEHVATEEAFKGVLDTHKANKTFCTVVRLLQQVQSIQRKISIKNRAFKELTIDLGIPPSVRLRYVEKVIVADDLESVPLPEES